jgi:Tfp pilus assembly protein PilO
VDRNRLWIIGTVAMMVVVVVGGWFLGIQPQLSAANAASESSASEAAQNATSERLLVTLKRDFAGIGELKDSNATLRRSVPSSAQLSTFVTELDVLASQNGVSVTTITVSDAKAYTPPVIVAVAVTGAAASPTPSPATSAAPVVAAPVAPQAPPLVTNPKITAANFIAIPIDLKISGQYANVLNFVKGLQTGERLFLVTNLSTAPPTATTAVTSTADAEIKGLIYVLIAGGIK